MSKTKTNTKQKRWLVVAEIVISAVSLLTSMFFLGQYTGRADKEVENAKLIREFSNLEVDYKYQIILLRQDRDSLQTIINNLQDEH